jgi:hypothetical protein
MNVGEFLVWWLGMAIGAIIMIYTMACVKKLI